jgi:hypothetical protein
VCRRAAALRYWKAASHRNDQLTLDAAVMKNLQFFAQVSFTLIAA